MNNIAIYLLCVIAGVGIGAICCYVWAIHHVTAMRAQVTVAEHKAELISDHQELTVQVVPYVHTSKESGWWSKSTAVEIGYQYQLFIRGLPCFEPHRIVTETRNESEINEDGIERLKAHAGELAQLALASTPGGRAAKIISLVGAQVTRQR